MAVDLAQKAQNFTNRGRQALETGRYELAVDMLMEAVSAAPDVLETRKLLRAAQIANFRKNGKAGFGAKLGYMMARQKIMGLVKKGQGVEAMAEAEKLLSQNPLDADNIEAAVKAAEAAGKADHAAVSIEAAYECSNRDPSLLERVATYYTMAKRWDKARDAYQKLSEMKPGDQDVLQKLKNCEAQATMNAGWEQTAGKKGGFQNLIANKEQAAKLDAANKAVVTGDDAELLIAEKLKQIEAEPKNMNARRALARLYVQGKRYYEAIEALQNAIEFAGTMDPELDRMLSQTKVLYFDQQIDALKAEGREEEALQMEGEKNQFVFDDLAQRVERYPNDLHLRFELGKQYFTYGYYDDALTHLQLAQKSPTDRLWSLYYLAMCFLNQGQTDMAVMQLETARDALPMMDDLKKNVVYQLGLCAEASGDLEKAYQYYKDVYSSDVGFEDLSERMLAVSQALK
ncbi:MAG: tetratricopeptide repeat protein, partial [Kiritimatiellae bacterium]|nr:tetratricopeptide repeat protein [Kiritimatiellia bacterium]